MLLQIRTPNLTVWLSEDANENIAAQLQLDGESFGLIGWNIISTNCGSVLCILLGVLQGYSLGFVLSTIPSFCKHLIPSNRSNPDWFVSFIDTNTKSYHFLHVSWFTRHFTQLISTTILKTGKVIRLKVLANPWKSKKN